MGVDLSAYAERIGYRGGFRADPDTLRALHLAHATHIPFENVDVLMGRPIELDMESLSRKLIHARRGGYCFEQNTLFAAVLDQCGFHVTRLAARVRWGAPAGAVRPRSHMLLAVELDGETQLADVGFGGEGLLWPVPLQIGEPSQQGAWRYRVVCEGDVYVLQAETPEGWLDLYGFTLEAQYPVDYQVANYYTSTHPNSIFRRMLRVQIPGPERRLMLLNRKLVERTREGVTETLLRDESELMKVLADRFGMRFPEGTRIPIEEAAGAF
ncbi:MAG TPA: arylamine N-acetyltransferase [Bryobacteraceae bacterium]|jgi:N-hydroxyarylamine O-acetyltransferase|nr:arylamine N-acetyltransferase [Bryobacteraceae bacterium]